MAHFQPRSPLPQLASDANGHRFWVAELRHPVEHVDRDHHLCCLPSSRSRPQPVSDNAFVSVHPVLRPSLMVSTGLLTPLASAYSCDSLQRLVPLAPRTFGPSTNDSRGLRRDHAHPSNQGCEESLGLPKREVEHGPQRQRRHDGDIRVLELADWPATRGRIPSFDRRLVEPDRDVAPLPKRLLLRSPVHHTILRLVSRSNSALCSGRHLFPPDFHIDNMVRTPRPASIRAMHQRQAT